MKLACLVLALALPVHGLEIRRETYKSVGDMRLEMAVQFPDGWKPQDKRPAIVFFFGGGWTGGQVRQFENHCRYLASRGMVAMAADYRVKSRQGVKPVSCVADAKTAIRWVRANAAKLGVDPNRIAAGGGSAGGHLAAATATLPGLDDSSDDLSVSCRPDALVLFNPALVLAPIPGVSPEGFEDRATMDRFGCAPEDISPAHHVRAGLPPTVIFHGKADGTVPYASAELFARRMTEAGNRCELQGAEGQAHGFFNFGRNENKYAFETLAAADRFLASLGWLEGEQKVDAFFAANPPTTFKR